MAKVTDLLIQHEGADPTNETVRSIAWVFLHPPRRSTSEEGPPRSPLPLRRLGPEGQLNPERRQA